MIKKLLVLMAVFCSGVGIAQDPDIFGDWQLTELHIDGMVYTAPSNNEIELVRLDVINGGSGNFVTSGCDELTADLTFTGSTALEFSNITTTLGGCINNNNSDFEQVHFDFFQNNGPDFTYVIADVGVNNVKQLVIRDINNNNAIYHSELLRQYAFKRWYLQYMVVDNIDIHVPVEGSQFPFHPEIEFGQTFDPAIAGYTGDGGCSVYSGSNTFVSDERVVTITSNSVDTFTCQTQIQIDFEALYLDFLFGTTPETFDYLYINDNGTVIFYLRNDENNYAIYGEDPPVLSVPESDFLEASIFPNPAANTFSISSAIPLDKINIYSINGSLLYSEENPNTTIDIRTLRSGIYFVEVVAENLRNIQKLIKE